MRAYVNIGLFSEGNSDHEFFRVLLARAVEAHARVGTDVVEAAAIERIAEGSRDPSGVAKIVRRRARDFTIIAVHHDCKARTRRVVHEEWIAPCIAALNDLEDVRVVGLLPMQEMEAWALADQDALRRALGVTARFDLPRPIGDLRALERESNPKALFNAQIAAAKRGLSARSDRKRYLAAVAREVDLDLLAGLSAFAAFRDELRTALRELRLAD